MTGTQRLTATLTSLDDGLSGLLEGVHAVAPIEVPLPDAIGCVAAGMPEARAPLPPFNIALADGWAMRAHDLAGVSSYAPLQLRTPVWVEGGDRLPDGCDCVIGEDAVEQSGPTFQVVVEAIPGEGIRRAGDDIAAGGRVIVPGRRVTAADVIVVRAAGQDTMPVRRPRVRVIGVPALDGRRASAEFIAASARAAGAQVTLATAAARDAVSIAAAMGDDAHDLLLVVGGSGPGRGDAAVAALAASGNVAAHGIALNPGRTAAVGRVAAVPAIVIPGAPSHAFAVWYALVLPALDRLTLHAPRPPIVRPLARKITSLIGSAELALLTSVDGKWLPLAAGDLPLRHIVTADAWLMVPAECEGYAAGTAVGAQPLRGLA